MQTNIRDLEETVGVMKYLTQTNAQFTRRLDDADILLQDMSSKLDQLKYNIDQLTETLDTEMDKLYDYIRTLKQ